MQSIASHQTKLAAALEIPPTMATPAVTRPRFGTIKQATHYYPFTEPALRDMRFKAFDRESSRGDVIVGNGSGEAGVWIELGDKVLLDFEALDRYLESRKVVALK